MDLDDYYSEIYEEIDEDDADLNSHLEVSDLMDDPDINKLYFSCPIVGTREEIIFKIWEHCEGWGCFDLQHQIERQCNSAINKILENEQFSGYIFIKMSYGDIEDHVDKIIRFHIDIVQEINIGDRVKYIGDVEIESGKCLKKGDIRIITDIRECENLEIQIEHIDGLWFEMDLFEKIEKVKENENVKEILDSIAEEL